MGDRDVLYSSRCKWCGEVVSEVIEGTLEMLRAHHELTCTEPTSASVQPDRSPE